MEKKSICEVHLFLFCFCRVHSRRRRFTYESQRFACFLSFYSHSHSICFVVVTIIIIMFSAAPDFVFFFALCRVSLVFKYTQTHTHRIIHTNNIEQRDKAKKKIFLSINFKPPKNKWMHWLCQYVVQQVRSNSKIDDCIRHSIRNKCRNNTEK